ncbi:MAG: hypothetical protein V4686_01645 [Patescibacteria group bacterium]
MSQKICPIVHRVYLAGQTERLKEPYPLSDKDGYSLRTIGIGDGHSLLLDTIDRFCNQDEWEGVALPSVHAFSRKADPVLNDKLLMDHIALEMLLKDPTQKFLRKIHKVYTCSRVEARFAFTESEDHVQTIGAERSSTTGTWFVYHYNYYRGVSRKYRPMILACLPQKVEKK